MPSAGTINYRLSLEKILTVLRIYNVPLEQALASEAIKRQFYVTF